jgi:hypothetical protein
MTGPTNETPVARTTAARGDPQRRGRGGIAADPSYNPYARED